MNIFIRPYKITDREFVLASWLNSYKFSSNVTQDIGKGIYYYNHEKIIDRLMGHSQIFIATLDEDDDVILGYLVCDEAGKTVHFLYVKNDWRNNGIARQLFNSMKHLGLIYFTHWTDACKTFVNRTDITMIYDPYRMGGIHEGESRREG